MTLTHGTRNGARPDEPPHNVEAEQAVLGVAIRDPDALGWLATHLDPLDFYRPAHRTIAALLAELHRDSLPVSQPLVLAALAERGALQDIGGGPYLLVLDEAAPPPSAVGWYGRRILDTARRRKVRDLVTALEQACREGMDAEGIAALGVDWFQQVLDGGHGDDGIAGPSELLDALREVRDRRLAGDRVSWHLENLDALTGGLEPGQMAIVAARPGAGKSALGLQLAARVAEALRAVFISFEMGRSQIARRQLALYAHCTTDAAVMSVDDDRLAVARGQYQGLDITYLDGHLDLDRTLAQVRALHARRPFRLVCVDYAQLIPVDPGRYKTREQEVAAISRALKLLARRLDVPVLVLAQLNRDADGREPVLRDLRESGQLEQDADLVVFLHETDRATKVIVAKNRDGETGWTWLRFDKPRTVFSDDHRALQS